MAGTGGPRPGAGRKPKPEKYSGPINKAEKQIVDKLPQIVQEQLKLALGGISVIKEKWIPRAAFSLGDLIAKGAGKTSEEAAKATENPEEMVLAERKVTKTLPDRAAGQYLINRIMGGPVQKVAPTDPSGEKEYGSELTDEAAINRLAAIFDLGRARGSKAPSGEDKAAHLDTPAGTSDTSG